MKIDLSAILEGRQREITAEYGYEPVDDGQSALLPKDLTLVKPIAVRLRATENHGYVTVRASAECEYDIPCDRCLEPVRNTVKVSIERFIDTAAPKEALEEEGGDVLTLVNGCVDADPDLTEEILLNLPMLHLCDPDCPGLCPRCGKKRVPGGCACPPEDGQ